MSQIIYISELSTDFSIMDCFQGKKQIYVENPWFTPNGAKPLDMKNYYTLKPSSGTSMGTTLKGPQLYLRKSLTDPFSADAKLCLTLSKDHKVTYNIKRPYTSDNSTPVAVKANMKLNVTINSVPSVTDTLELIDARMLTLYEISFTCKVLDISLKNYADMPNEAFWTKFNDDYREAISTILTNKGRQLKKPVTIDDRYKRQWDTHIYICRASNASHRLVDIEHPTDGEELDLNTIAEAPTEKSYQSILVTALKYTSFNGLKSEQLNFSPMMYKKLYTAKDGTAKIYDNCDLIFRCKVGNSKVPDAFITKKLSRRSGKTYQDLLTDRNISELWGNDKPSANLNGFVIVSIKFEYMFYKMASSNVKWTVSLYNGTFKDVGSSIALRDEDLPELACSDDEDTTPATQPVKAPVLHKADDDDIDLNDEDF